MHTWEFACVYGVYSIVGNDRMSGKKTEKSIHCELGKNRLVSLLWLCPCSIGVCDRHIHVPYRTDHCTENRKRICFLFLYSVGNGACPSDFPLMVEWSRIFFLLVDSSLAKRDTRGGKNNRTKFTNVSGVNERNGVGCPLSHGMLWMKLLKLSESFSRSNFVQWIL